MRSEFIRNVQINPSRQFVLPERVDTDLLPDAASLAEAVIAARGPWALQGGHQQSGCEAEAWEGPLVGWRLRWGQEALHRAGRWE